MTKLTDIRARNIKPTDRPVSDGVVTGLSLIPGKLAGCGKWSLRFKSPVLGTP